MNIIKNLQYAIVGKFSYGWPDIAELREQIPKYCVIKGESKIRFIRNGHVLIRLELVEDFVNILYKSAYYINDKNKNSYQMRPLIYDSFRPEEETTQVLA